MSYVIFFLIGGLELDDGGKKDVRPQIMDRSRETSGGPFEGVFDTILHIVIALSVCVPFAATPSFAEAPPTALFPNNIDCRQFEKTGSRTWNLRDEKSIDLGNWDGEFIIQGTIMPGKFTRHGSDLYDVLEGKCDIKA